MILLDHIISITISQSHSYGEVNKNYFKVIHDARELTYIENSLKKAHSKKQKIDIMKEKPDFDLIIHYRESRTHLLHLVLGDRGETSRIMYVSYENTSSIIPSDETLQ